MKRKTVAIRAAAGVMAAVLVTMAAAGIWGSRSDSKNHTGGTGRENGGAAEPVRGIGGFSGPER